MAKNSNITNLNIDTGFKKFTINGDPEKTISFNPSDVNILTRFEQVKKNIIKMQDEIDGDIFIKNDGTPVEQSDESVKIIKKANNYICEQIDFLFDSKISNIVFGNVSPFATVKGEPYYERFLNAVLPIIKDEVNKEEQASKKRMEKYTLKYIK